MIYEWYWSFEGCENFDITQGFCDDFRSDFSFFLMFVFPQIFPLLLGFITVLEIFSKEKINDDCKDCVYLEYSRYIPKRCTCIDLKNQCKLQQ